MAVGLAEEVTDPEELRAAQRLDLRPLASGDRSHLIQIRPEFLSGRRIT